MPQEKTTEEIIRDFKRGHQVEENFRLLFLRYHGHLNRFFRRKLMTPEECRDLTQLAFISVYKGLKDLRQESQFENWMYRIALNEFRNEIEHRHAKKRDVVYVGLEEGEGGGASPARQVIDPRANPMTALLEKEKLEKLRSALEELPEQMRRCAQLRVGKDLSYQEIAIIMGISINTVKAHLHQAQKALKEKLRHYFDEVEV